MIVLQLPSRVAVDPKATPPRVATYRPANGFLCDEPQPRLPNAPDKGYPRRPGKR